MSSSSSHVPRPPGGPGDALRQISKPTPQAFDIRIAADGNWYHEGGLIGRPALVKLFASVLQREADGSYWLVTPVERGTIMVEDAPFIITAMSCEGVGRDQQIRFTTNVGDTLLLGRDNPMVMRPTAGPDTGSGHQPGAGAATPELRPYVTVRQALEALVARPVFYELAEQSVAGEDGRFGVWSDGVFFPLEAGANADQDGGA
ncbi:MAG: DUF1285 domain-containing protein [Alphaproteobacteria bacterium]|jgi:hypothetical protein|nr:proteophosphoglycan precursor [Rhodospirillaceae bacterium]MBL6624852.1 DUF1285 domain-containing protein [Alphaproteobacteria bacterium]MBL6672859.1 DUF1285 domain-containing protein [Alphaproteobacteria bacterium]HBP73903.1 DUF1285 domain-containing protein [Alphaproteobacteria bacterium]